MNAADFAAYMAETEPKQNVRGASVYAQEEIDDLGKIIVETGGYLPWAKTHKLLRFRPGEVTLWAGVNGHGKSMVTGLAALSLCMQEQRVCIASFEMKPRRSIGRMLRQWSGQAAPTEQEMAEPEILAGFRDLYEQFRDWSDKRLWFYDQQGTVKPEIVLAVMRYCGTELGIKHFFVDNLMKCVADEDDYNGQKRFVDEATAVARDTGMHVHIVHHIKKLADEAKTPDKMDVKGSGSITDQVDNLLIVWRNKAKEKNLAAGKLVAEGDPDAMLFCEKQRNGEWEGRISLWFHRTSQQYLGSPNAGLLDMYNFPHGDFSGSKE